jgi:general secretion pathway protein D
MKRLIASTALGLLLVCTPLSGSAQGLNVQGADIRAFIQDVARVTNRTFIVDPRVRGTVSVVSDERLTRDELFQVLLSTLRANGLVAVQLPNGAYRIAPEEGAAQSAAAGGGVAGFATEVFRLRNLGAAAAVNSLKPLVGKQGVITASPQGDAVIVSDYADNLRRIRTLLAQVDQTRASTQTVTLENSSAREIAEVVNGLLLPAGAPANARNDLVSVVVVDSSNSLILRGDPETVSQLLPVIADLDRRARESNTVRVIRLQHADAEEMLPVLQQLVGAPVTPPSPAAQARSSSLEQGPGEALGRSQPQPQPVAATTSAAPPPEGGARANIARYPGANALVIAADPETQRLLGDVIRQLDVRREQVLIEAVVVEISDNAAKELGVQFLLGGDGLAAANYSNRAPNILAITGAAAGANTLDNNTLQGVRDAAIGSVLGSSGFLAGGGGLINDDTLFSLIINAVKRDTASNILQTPSLMTLNNREATILVGQEVPITTGEVLGDNNNNPFRTIQRQNVGVQLEVKPQINAGGAVTLFLRQEVSSVSRSTTATGELIIDKREIETTVLAEDGDIIVLGGLLDQNETLTDEKIPVLGDLPVVGNLFRNRSRQRAKRNLVVFIRPRIVRTAEDARKVTAPRYDYVQAEQMQTHTTLGPSSATLDALVRDYLQANPPGTKTALPPPPAAAAPGAAPVLSAAPVAPVQSAPLAPVAPAQAPR